MGEVLIALGANLGDRRAHLARAVEALRADMALDALSRLYETAPMYVADQPAFLNMAVRGRTALAPRALLDRLKEIEDALGRETTYRNGPRAIDLDILYHGDRIVSDDRLTVPHPRIAERAFVLVPLMDIAPDWIDPARGESVRAMHDAVPGRDTVRLAEPPELDAGS
ncbi:2-amino-4-hydroxy-6-hydroxymethyldihydropteridine diphosphokinase [Marivibrio halodurans]|uniref:2-amino-4-hydroxy-6-hydroxymethyldihydropteridine pyrophosphokinase n=1 Tax=Marivibrio halodurans TaxID=2039722 RepID=A0A8J7V353_9PROT|nr:2-amino-4-hydroxy-6-hydroxymethyldihydropteridine diphosphokinase [Marivibrio halodurans]MBP5856459.1 2-amino-4-hydroxy-6-hydroxymethyldihydropteridine diphosphokinase [Marivibrio halodurans]